MAARLLQLRAPKSSPSQGWACIPIGTHANTCVKHICATRVYIYCQQHRTTQTHSAATALGCSPLFWSGWRFVSRKKHINMCIVLPSNSWAQAPSLLLDPSLPSCWNLDIWAPRLQPYSSCWYRALYTHTHAGLRLRLDPDPHCLHSLGPETCTHAKWSLNLPGPHGLFGGWPGPPGPSSDRLLMLSHSWTHIPLVPRS